MLGGVTVHVDGTEFARACHNALCQIPARPARFPWARLALTADLVTVMGTDGYTLGRATCRLEGVRNVGDGISVCVPREGLAELDRLGRAAKGTVAVIVRPEAVEVVSMGSGGAAGIVMCEPVTLPMIELWEAADEILNAWPTKRPAIPELLALDPVLWARFAKVKVETRKAAMADLLITAVDDPVLVKIGPAFVGAIMPVDRTVAAAAEARGEDFLW
ncbi:hypothetical protein [Yinghuangia sp. YIM S09857]|uniref:hypothetical protein n=1 Tax=Yinghuangia sp. YIM S09857 TaxID=3436929 RepID=UPI003F533558